MRSVAPAATVSVHDARQDAPIEEDEASVETVQFVRTPRVRLAFEQLPSNAAGASASAEYESSTIVSKEARKDSSVPCVQHVVGALVSVGSRLFVGTEVALGAALGVEVGPGADVGHTDTGRVHKTRMIGNRHMAPIAAPARASRPGADYALDEQAGE